MIMHDSALLRSRLIYGFARLIRGELIALPALNPEIL